MHATETALRNALQTIRGQMTTTSAIILTTDHLVGLIDQALALPEVPVTLLHTEPTSNHGYLIIDCDGDTTYCDDAQRVEDHLDELLSMNGPSLDGVEVLKITRARQISYEINVKLIEN